MGFQELPSVLGDRGELPQLTTSAGEPAFGGRGHFLLQKGFEFSILKLLWFFFFLKGSLKITTEWQVLGIHARKTNSVTEGVNKSRRKSCSTIAISELGKWRQEDSGHTATWVDRRDYCLLAQWLSRVCLNFAGSCMCLQDTNNLIPLVSGAKVQPSSDLSPSFLASDEDALLYMTRSPVALTGLTLTM